MFLRRHLLLDDANAPDQERLTILLYIRSIMCRCDFVPLPVKLTVHAFLDTGWCSRGSSLQAGGLVAAASGQERKGMSWRGLRWTRILHVFMYDT